MTLFSDIADLFKKRGSNLRRLSLSYECSQAMKTLDLHEPSQQLPFLSDSEFIDKFAIYTGLYASRLYLESSGNHQNGSDEDHDELCDALMHSASKLREWIYKKYDAMSTPPRALRVARLLGITTPKEIDAFLYVVVLHAVPWLSSNPLLTTTASHVARFAQMSPTEYLAFTSEERLHFKQGVLEFSHNSALKLGGGLRGRDLGIQPEVVMALCGVPLTESELVKMENTALVEVLLQDGVVFGGGPIVITNQEGGDDLPDAEAVTDKDHDCCPAKNYLNGNEEPYCSELEYLDDQFKYIATLIQLRTLEADTKDEDPESNGGGANNRQKIEAQLREMQGRERLCKLRIDRRIAKSQSNGFIPRMEALATSHNLTQFEKMVLLLLVGNSISHEVLIAANGKNIMRGHYHPRECNVSYVLFVLCDGLSARVKQRESFQRSSVLVREGLITVSVRSHGHSCAVCELNDCLVEMDRKLIDHITGLSTSFTDIIDGSTLYSPTVNWDQVVLPEDAVEKVEQTILHFDRFVECRTRIGFSEIGHQGLVMMFCGPSGTGKTMLANAIGHKMGKRMLLVNVLQYQQSGRYSMGVSELFKFIFREARLHNAIVFFDECEAFFEGGGGSNVNPMVLSLLVELERYAGLVILATNNPQLMHEAMHRRITLTITFRVPTYHLRARIWQSHIPSKLRVACNTDFSALAMNYELTGGLIKNAVLAAIAFAVAREGSSDPLVTQNDFVEGAKLQLRGAFSAALAAKDGTGDTAHIIPRKTLSNLILDAATTSSIQDIVKLIKSKATLLSSAWGAEQDDPADQQLSCGFLGLFYGPSACGKSTAVEAIAFECGVTLRVLNVAELLLKHNLQVSSQIETAFTESRKQNAILVLDDAEKLLDHSEGALELSQLIQYFVSRFPRPVFMLVRTERLELDFSGTNLKCSSVVRFSIPNKEIRKTLWKQSIPSGVTVGDDINFDILAEKQVCGGVIRNVCFLACAKSSSRHHNQSNPSITMKAILQELEGVMKLTHDRHRNLFV